jgi:hypothetical protein
MTSKIRLTASFLAAALFLHLSSVSISAERLKFQFPGISVEDVRIHLVFGKVKTVNEGANAPR